MKLLIVCVSAAFALGAGGCTSGDAGIPATPSFDPFGGEAVPPTGSEPTRGGNETPPGGDSLLELCARACANIQSSCPGSSDSGPDCASDCAQSVSNFPSCAPQFQAFVACVATAPLSCTDGSITAPTCDATEQAISDCVNQTTTAG